MVAVRPAVIRLRRPAGLTTPGEFRALGVW
jgi:hypothetical protein